MHPKSGFDKKYYNICDNINSNILQQRISSFLFEYSSNNQQISSYNQISLYNQIPLYNKQISTHNQQFFLYNQQIYNSQRRFDLYMQFNDFET